jgi:hypothetical protein
MAVAVWTSTSSARGLVVRVIRVIRVTRVIRVIRVTRVIRVRVIGLGLVQRVGLCRVRLSKLGPIDIVRDCMIGQKSQIGAVKVRLGR